MASGATNLGDGMERGSVYEVVDSVGDTLDGNEGC